MKLKSPAINNVFLKSAFVLFLILTAGFLILLNFDVRRMLTLPFEQYFKINSNVLPRMLDHSKLNWSITTGDDPHVKDNSSVTPRMLDRSKLNWSNIPGSVSHVKDNSNVSPHMLDHSKLNVSNISDDKSHVEDNSNVSPHMLDHSKLNMSNISGSVPHMLDHSKLNVSNISDDKSHVTVNSNVSPHMFDHSKLNMSDISGDGSLKVNPNEINNNRSLCPQTPPGLVGPIDIDRHVHQLDVLEKRYFPTRSGGHFKPAHCESRTKVAIIVAYRNRKDHLLVLLNNLIPFLIKQQAEFAIFIVEPVPALTFNRALLMNVGFVESLKTNNFTCFVLHDVDLIPVNDLNLYRCENNPRHMSVANSKYNYRLPYAGYAGGVTAVSKSTFEDINGMSNLYFGWGGEDDDLVYRLNYKRYKMVRYPMNIGRYVALGHNKDKGNPDNPQRFRLVGIKSKTPRSAAFDGLSSLKYKIVVLQNKPLYTWILTDIDMAYYNKQLSDTLNST